MLNMRVRKARQTLNMTTALLGKIWTWIIRKTWVLWRQIPLPKVFRTKAKVWLKMRQGKLILKENFKPRQSKSKRYSRAHFVLVVV